MKTFIQGTAAVEQQRAAGAAERVADERGSPRVRLLCSSMPDGNVRMIIARPWLLTVQRCINVLPCSKKTLALSRKCQSCILCWLMTLRW